MSDKIILVAGGAGQVARAMADLAVPAGIRIVTRGRPQLDLLEPRSIESVFEDLKPDLVVNAAAYTAVDQAESEEAAAFALNAKAAGELAATAARSGVPMIHISTDYVFDGTNAEPYMELDPVAPLGVYGRSKLAGEEAVAAANPDHVILRTAWVYSPVGKNFIKTMLRVGSARDELGVVHDQRGNPTSAADIAAGILEIATQVLSGKTPVKPGIYHMTAQGEASWAEFAEHIFQCSAKAGGPVADVKRITSAEYPTPVARPANSRLNCTKIAEAYGVVLPHWQGSTQACVEQLVKTGEWNS
ncbi:dTDP-4-dehydrorhamnose reductase [Hyphomonas jannaschiana]|uniref:dTDP-4-dehydrorhamnose reductase n=1 Tax=Hyphomonas jannaschiana TaxID=86 RepID=UPI0035C72022